MMVSFIICFLPALLATTSAQGILTCEKCYGIRQKCQAPTENCTVTTGVGGCRSAAAESTLGGRMTSVFYKECIADYNSGVKGPISFNVGNGLYLRVNAAECNTDKCNSAVLEMPKENTTLNGRQCPACFSLDANSCKSESINCTGDENYCISFVGQIFQLQGGSLSPFAAQGCGSASTQDIKPGSYLTSGNNVYLFEQVTSTPPEKITTTPATTTLGTTTTIPSTTTTAETITPTPTTTTPTPTPTPTPTTTTTLRTTTPTPTTTTTTLGTTTTAPTSPITITSNTTEDTRIITTEYVNTTLTTKATTTTISYISPAVNVTTTLTSITIITTVTTLTNTITVTTQTTAVSITTTTANPPTTNTNSFPPTSTTTTETLPRPTATT